MNRRALLIGAAAAGLIRPSPVLAQTTGVTPIFIKWDAWYNNTETVTRQFHEQLSPARWQFRAPWFCEVLGPDRITCNGQQTHVDLELQAAANAGIKAFAYVWYGGDATGAGMSASLFRGWQLHQSSAHKDLTKWCGYAGMERFGYNPWSNTAGWQANCNIWAQDYFKRSNYLKIGGRPVLFILNAQSQLNSHFAGSSANSVTSFNYLRSQSVASGAGNPYIITMGSLSNFTVDSPSAGLAWVTGDAISSYVASSVLSYPKLPQPFVDLTTKNAQYWAGSQGGTATGNKVVPIAMLGWDSRPLNAMPEFERGYTPWVGHQWYYTRGTNTEIANHLQACVNFIGANQPACDSKIFLAYAWNENCEGGTVGMPTLGDPPTGTPPTTALLTAIKPVLTAAA